MTATAKAGYKSKFITAELARLFSQSDDEEEFEGFSDEEDVKRSGRLAKHKIAESEDSDVDTGFYSDDEATQPRRSLCVALKFPSKRVPTPKHQPPEEEKVKKVLAATPPRRASVRNKLKEEARAVDKKMKMMKEAAAAPPSSRRGAIEKKKREEIQKKMKLEEEDEEDRKEEALCLSLRKRDKNIMENKAMLAQLFADLSSIAELTSLDAPPAKRSAAGEKIPSPRKRRAEPPAGAERRNPGRKARPPEHFGVEEKPAAPGGARHGPRTLDIRRLVEVDEDGVKMVKRRRFSAGSKRGRYQVRPVDDITQEELDNIASRPKDKIWDKDNGSSCHQCRQKTLDTKTVCRSGTCAGVKGQFCGPCLKNRYGEEVREVLLDPTWACPLCRGVCNCSLCRRREGRCATGTLVGLARYNGHDNVHQYLQSIQRELQ